MVYMIMVTLLLVNMLIAMMGNTYQLVAETQKEYFRQVSKPYITVGFISMGCMMALAGQE